MGRVKIVEGIVVEGKHEILVVAVSLVRRQAWR